MGITPENITSYSYEKEKQQFVGEAKMHMQVAQLKRKEITDPKEENECHCKSSKKATTATTMIWILPPMCRILPNRIDMVPKVGILL